MVSAVGVVLALVVAAPTGRASFEEGRRRFLAGDHEGALVHLQRAYDLSRGRPSTIEALALCHDRLGHTALALTHYRELLATSPREPKAGEVRSTIARLERAMVAEEARLRPVAPAPPAPEPDNFAVKSRPPAPPAASAPSLDADEDRAVWASPWFWIVTGAVAATAAVGVGLAMSAGGDPLPPSLDRRFVR